MTFLFDAAAITASILTAFTSMLMVVLVPTMLVTAAYKRVTTGLWSQKQPTFSTDKEQKSYLEGEIERLQNLPGRYTAYAIYLSPIVLFAAPFVSTSPDRNMIAKVFLAALVNAAIVAFGRSMIVKGQTGLELKLRTLLDKQKAEQADRRSAEEERRRAEEQLRRAHRQADKDREYAQRREHEQAQSKKKQEDAERHRREKQRQRRSYEENSREGSEGARAWHKVLGVPLDASADEIKKAYLSLIKQYHPDMVFNLGVELKELANRKSAEINQAYNEAMSAR